MGGSPVQPGPGSPRPARFLVRHGQTERNLQGRLQGQGDAPLTSDGKEFATKTASVLSNKIGVGEVIIYTSPLGRAKETARIIAKQLPSLSKMVSDDRIAEVDLGKWDGMTLTEIDSGWPGALDSAPLGERFFTVAVRYQPGYLFQKVVIAAIEQF